MLLFLIGVAVARGQVSECPSEQETDWTIEQLLRHEDCHKFYKCTFGYPVEYTCPHNLYFNLDLWECDWPHNVDCEGRNDPALTTAAPVTAEPTTLAPTTPEPTTPKPTTSEPTTPVPTTPEPTTLAPTTPEPTTPVPTTPEPTTPEPNTPEPTAAPTAPPTPAPTPAPTAAPTVAPTAAPTAAPTDAPTDAPTTKVPGCEVEVWPQPEPQPEPQPQPQPEPQPPTEEEEVEIDFLANGCPVDPHIHWLLPHAEDCNLFYYCVWGELVLRECPSALHFNPVIQVFIHL